MRKLKDLFDIIYEERTAEEDALVVAYYRKAATIAGWVQFDEPVGDFLNLVTGAKSKAGDWEDLYFCQDTSTWMFPDPDTFGRVVGRPKATNIPLARDHIQAALDTIVGLPELGNVAGHLKAALSNMKRTVVKKPIQTRQYVTDEQRERIKRFLLEPAAASMTDIAISEKILGYAKPTTISKIRRGLM